VAVKTRLRGASIVRAVHFMRRLDGDSPPPDIRLLVPDFVLALTRGRVALYGSGASSSNSKARTGLQHLFTTANSPEPPKMIAPGYFVAIFFVWSHS
jgi:hypothetical protein